MYGDMLSPQGPACSGREALVLPLWWSHCLALATARSCLSASCSRGPISVPIWDLDFCSCLFTALLFSGHTASGWISHPTSDSEKGKRRLRWALTRLPVDPAGLAWILSWLTLTVPPAKAPASSLSHSAPAASPGPGSLSTALALRIGTEDHCFASVDSGGRKGHHGGHWDG